VEIPSNLLFFVALVILVVVSIQLSYELSKHEARIRRLAEEIALMKLEIKKLQSKNDPD
jgi:cell division protein ZapA (FtsZ GTPase activity inhibitor)